jgi:hypothetical protein
MLAQEAAEGIVKELIMDGTSENNARKMVERFEVWLENFEDGKIKIVPSEYARRFIDDIYFPAGFGTTVFAQQGMGKTNLAVFLIESALVFHPKWVFLHTVPFVREVYNISLLKDRLIEIRSASAMMRNIINVIRSGNIPVLCLDEWDSVYNAVNVNSKQGKSWSSFVWRQRHFSVRGPLMIYHALNSVPKAIRNGMTAGQILWIKGVDRQRYISGPRIKAYDSMNSPGIHMKIPKATVPYLTHGNVGFEIDLDFSDILNKVSGSQEEVLDQIEERLSFNIGREDEEKRRREEIKMLKEQVKKKGRELLKEGLKSGPELADELRSLFPEAEFINSAWVRNNIF